MVITLMMICSRKGAMMAIIHSALSWNRSSVDPFSEVGEVKQYRNTFMSCERMKEWYVGEGELSLEVVDVVEPEEDASGSGRVSTSSKASKRTMTYANTIEMILGEVSNLPRELQHI
jgi:hypothetical protein